MKQARVAETLNRAAGLLLDLANKLDGHLYQEDGPIGRIQTFWHNVTLSPVMEVGSTTIDLATKEGKWELLVLALLKAARVTDEIVAVTFEQLKRKALLDVEGLLEGDVGLRTEIEHVFSDNYRALCHRDAKISALFYNARLLHSAWDGDLQNLYETATNDDELVASLQRFRQINRIALWICRTLYVHGLWPQVGKKARCYVDRSVRLPLQRLGMADYDLQGNGFVNSVEEIDRMITTYFGGDAVPLFLHGFSLCAEDDPAVCLAECPVSAWCAFPRACGNVER